MLHFNVSEIQANWRINKIAWAPIPFRRPRCAGKNARLGVHGWGGHTPIVQIEAEGITGFGWGNITKQETEAMVGAPLRALFRPDSMMRRAYRKLEFPVLDWLGHFLRKPVYELVAKNPMELTEPYSIPIYDTSIYFDELHLTCGKEAVALICQEVQEGLAAGHENFKVKIGRCGMWMDLEPGLRRDIEIVLAIRQLIGEKGKLMVDANNAYNINITKRFLSESREAKLHWIEEAFHEDDVLYAELTRWMKEEGIATLIADGEGYASPALLDWTKKGLIQVLQYSLRNYGFFNWMELVKEIEDFGIRFAPHNYGNYYGNYAQAHFAACTSNFDCGEFDTADAEGIDNSAYQVKAGRLIVPPKYGFGLTLDQSAFDSYRKANGWEAAI